MNAVKVDPAVIEAAIKEYTSIRDDLEAARERGEALTQISGPGQDTPSMVFGNAASAVGNTHQHANMDLGTAIQARIDLLQATLNQYRQTDEGKAADLKPKD